MLDKPFCITEYGHPAPNDVGSEGSLLAGPTPAYRIGTTSTSRFAQRNDFPLRRIRQWFDIDQHPTKMMTLIPAAAMFLRGDVAPAKEQVVAILDRQQELDLLPRQSLTSPSPAEEPIGVVPFFRLVQIKSIGPTALRRLSIGQLDRCRETL